MAAAFDSVLIDTTALAEWISEGELVLIDAENPINYSRAHIPGAINLHYLEFKDAEENARTGRPVFPQLVANKLGGLGVSHDAGLVVYDSGDGRAASSLWYILKFVGHEDVRVLDGGFRKWIAEGRPVGQETPPRPKLRYIVGKAPRADWALTSEEMRAGKAVLVDARSVEEYAGRKNDGAGRPGHIPGAISFPWDRLAGPLATFKDEAALRRALEQAGLAPDKEIVVYCDTGLGRSTFLLLSATLLGYEKLRIYPGSYLEWAADPARPVAR